MKRILILIGCMFFLSSCHAQETNKGISQEHMENPYYSRTDKKKLNISNAEWKKVLNPQLYQVARLQATE